MAPGDPPDSAGGTLADLFAEAHERPPAEREALLVRLRRERPDLEPRLRELLQAAAAADSMLDRGLAELVPADPAADDAPLPTHIGPYRLLREIGRGGMGRVFLAEQHEPEFRRTVALKIIDRAGIAGERVRRFRDEVRILASLEHPGIARFLDGGRADDGTWFLALEYVEGTDLLTHCRDAGLGVRERLQLFVAVLDAVAHAHGRGIVHRDLKPGNVLVGADGGPRLLDFGISKLVDAAASTAAGDAAPNPTRTELRAFTPAYASPEQFRGEPVTAASDIFSLGVVLCELLTGERPFGDATTPPAKLAAAVLAGDPQSPSAIARRQTRRSSRASSPTARGDGGETPTVRGERLRLGRDLDAICLKALRREPQGRYASAVAFADDVRAYLDQRPVAARRGGWRYRAGRFVGRHRGRIAAAAVLILAGAFALAGARGLLLERAQRRAEPPPRVFPYSAPTGSAVEDLEREFLARPADLETGAELALALGAAGRRPEATITVSRLRQIPGREQDPLIDYVDGVLANQSGERQRALVLLSTALDRARAGGRGELVAQVRATRGATLSALGRDAEARPEMELARRAFQQSRDWASLARVFSDLAQIERRAGHLSRAEGLLTVALRLYDVLPADLQRARTPSILHNLGSVATERGRPDLGIERLEEAARLQHAANDRLREGRALTDLAVAHWYAGHGVEAEDAVERSITLKREVASPSSLAFSLFFRGSFAAERGQLARTAEDERGLRAIATSAGDRFALALAEDLAGRAAFARGELAEGRQHFAESRRLALAASNAESASDTDILQGRLELDAGELEAAASAAERAAAPYRAEGEKATVATAEALLARIAARTGQTAEAERRLAALGKADNETPMADQRLLRLATRADLAERSGNVADARAAYTAAITACATASRITAGMSLRLDAAAFDRRHGNAAEGRAAARALEREAQALDLTALAKRAQSLAELVPEKDDRAN